MNLLNSINQWSDKVRHQATTEQTPASCATGPVDSPSLAWSLESSSSSSPSQLHSATVPAVTDIAMIIATTKSAALTIRLLIDAEVTNVIIPIGSRSAVRSNE